MKKILFLLLPLMTLSAFSQELNILGVTRFNASLASNKQVTTTAPSLKISQTDTTNWFSWSPAVGPNDTLMEAVVYANVDSSRASIKVQYGLNGMVVSTGVIDSLSYISTPLGTQAKGKALYFSRPPGTNQVRVIVATASTGNQGGYLGTPTKTYAVAIVTRIKKK